MSVILYPDIIAASEAKESIEDVLLICKNNKRLGKDHFLKEISQVYVSAERCVRRQVSYAKRGLGNVFLGLGGKTWSVDDYISYFESNPEKYKRVTGNGHKYAVDLKENFKTMDIIEDEDIKKRIKAFCLTLLTQETYSPEVLEKFGIY